MIKVVRKAFMGSSSRRKYATGKENYKLQKIYFLMQCTQDLSQTDCETCLRETVGAFQRSFNGKQGGYIIDLYPFYELNVPLVFQPYLLQHHRKVLRRLSQTPQSQKASACMLA